ncbi:hypothetical protein Hanom_Chr07g00634311 [Helianthus anomalus]
MKILTSWFRFPAFIGILQHSSRVICGCGCKSVFKGGDRVVEIPIDESHRFIY